MISSDRMRPAKAGFVFTSESYWIWCGSPIHAEGAFHLFASRWPKSLPFSPHWVTHSEIIRGSSPALEGPYRFQEVVLGGRGGDVFDARVTHNPQIRSYNGNYYLYYFGTTYRFPPPDPAHPLRPKASATDLAKFREAWGNKRIGLATSASIKGPWKRYDAPILLPSKSGWDQSITTNPSVAIRPDGYTLMVYKSSLPMGHPEFTLKLGVAAAPHPSGPFQKLRDTPIFDFHCEDPFLWWEAGAYHMLFKDFNGGICGEPFGGACASSPDGVHWEVHQGRLAYSRTLHDEDGNAVTHGSLERPALYLENGKPTHLFNAASCDERKMWDTPSTGIVCRPISV